MSVTLQLTPVHGSFPFEAKSISLPKGSVVTLGSEPPEDSHTKRRKASPDNGLFAPRRPITMASLSGGLAPPARSSLSLSPEHAKVWSDGAKVYIQDTSSPWGTYVNGEAITGAAVLRTGDTICLGKLITRNNLTPSYITDEELRPIAADVSIAIYDD